MSNLTHVVPGEPFNPAAGDWNAFVDAARTVRDARLISQPGELLAVTVDSGIVEGTLTSAVTAASPNGKTGATTFTIKLWSLDDTDTHDPQYLAASTDDTTGVNTTNRTAISGSHAFCAYMNGRLQFLFGDCP